MPGRIPKKIKEKSRDAPRHNHKDEKGEKQLVVYKYLKDRGWIFMVRDSEAEVYGSVTQIRAVVGLLCAAVAAAVIFVTVLILRRVGRDLMVMENAIGRLGNLDLSADRELDRFFGRSDEIGLIAHTIHHVCGCLRKTIEDVARILKEMADGNLAVDVAKNEDYYIGDFQVF